MPQYLAFLRALNVGGRIVQMAAIKKYFEQLGFTQVETFIASGSVIFQSPSKSVAKLEQKIAIHLKQVLGYDVATFLRSVPQVVAAAAHQRFWQKMLPRHTPFTSASWPRSHHRLPARNC